MKTFKEEDQILYHVKHIHMIGIGGSGMCPLAEILHSKGYELTGSDNNPSDPLARVSKFAKVTLGHDAKNIEGAELVIYSSAIKSDNVELKAARDAGIPTMERKDLLGAVSRMYGNVIGVCGTHGKTTVTSLITQILVQTGQQPNAVIGGKLPLVDHYGVVGASENMVIEADEFVDTFLKISEDVAVILNIDNDHMEYFKTMDNMIHSFHQYAANAKTVFVNGDDANSLKAAEGLKSEIIHFGLTDQCDYYATNIQSGKFGYRFDACYRGEKLAEVQMMIPGRHNVYNGLIGFAVCHHMGLECDEIVSSIAQFRGAGRRFEFIGDYGFVLADDYGHHPTEIRATLQAAKELDYQRVVVIFQPFTFSRTALLKEDFAQVLSIADEVILTPIMGSREVNTYNIYSEDILALMDKGIIIDGFDKIRDYVIAHYGKGDLVITMGCGDIYKAAHLISEYYQKKGQ